MAIKLVLMIGNQKLRKKSAQVTNFDNVSKVDKQFKTILIDLKDTLTHLQKTKKIGRALAAPQIGYLKKIIFMQTLEKTFYMINPVITWKSNEMFEVWDSCFSFGVYFFVKIKRHKKIIVEYKDENGTFKKEEFEDDLSELFQHEIDHLDGI
ncbi:peptide deformylase, partial [Candidatus Woesearchaeota archaeon]|nr:peptide deformylase [Candidatus Woesearchaeota archaeon]